MSDSFNYKNYLGYDPRSYEPQYPRFEYPKFEYPKYEAPKYEPPKARSSPPLWLIVVCIVFVAILQYCKRACREEEEERQRFESTQTPHQQPTVAIISEISNRRTYTRPARNESSRINNEYDLVAATDISVQSLSNGSSRTPEESALNRPPPRNDSVPQYENPPNYEEALKLLNVDQKQNRDSPIT